MPRTYQIQVNEYELCIIKHALDAMIDEILHPIARENKVDLDEKISDALQDAHIDDHLDIIM